MDNRFLINELLKNKKDEGALLKHWFKYGIVLSALGILKELDRQDIETKDDDGEKEETEALDLKQVARICAGLARVVVPMIRALHKGPSQIETVAQAAE
jgi:hypothetical protein